MRQKGFTYFWTLLQPGTSPVIKLDLCIVLTACRCLFLDNGLWHRRIITKKVQLFKDMLDGLEQCMRSPYMSSLLSLHSAGSISIYM